MAFSFEGKGMYSIFVFAKCCGSIYSSDKAWQQCAQQTEKSYSHTKSAVSRQVYVHALLVQHLYSVFFQYMVWHCPTSETASMQGRQKNWLKYTYFTELKKITSRIHSKLFELFFSFFQVDQISLLFVRFHEKSLQLTVQVCCLFYFLLHSTFCKRKIE